MVMMNPEQMAQLQQIQQLTKDVFAEVVIDKAAGTMMVTLSTKNPQAEEVIPNMLDQMSVSLGTQLESFFLIKGKIVEVE